jgi:hypothetical protein
MTTPLAAFLGLIYGFVVTGLSFIIAGGGHGWCSSLISAVGLILLPLAAVARVRRCRALAVAGIVLGGLADIALLVATTREGFEYVERIFATIPVLVLFWGGLWLLWQIALLTGLLRGTFASPPSVRKINEQ